MKPVVKEHPQITEITWSDIIETKNSGGYTETTASKLGTLSRKRSLIAE